MLSIERRLVNYILYNKLLAPYFLLKDKVSINLYFVLLEA
jgi:hypothetical protein